MARTNKDKAPDVEKLMARADADIARDETWRARQRLATYVSQFKGEPRFAARLGAMLLDIGEMPDAQKMLCDGCSLEESHQAIIASYLAKKSEKGKLRSAVRRALLHASEGTSLPPAIVQAIESEGLVLSEEIERAVQRRDKKKADSAASHRLLDVGCTLFAALLLLIFILGIGRFFDIIRSWH